MKRSRSVALTILASACLIAGCAEEQKTERDLYADKEKCEQDWGSAECEPARTGGGYYGPHYYYFGGRPWYFPFGRNEPVAARPDQAISRVQSGSRAPGAVASTSSSRTLRGGFGGLSSFHGGGS